MPTGGRRLLWIDVIGPHAGQVGVALCSETPAVHAGKQQRGKQSGRTGRSHSSHERALINRANAITPDGRPWSKFRQDQRMQVPRRTVPTYTRIGGQDMNARVNWNVAVAAIAVAISVQLPAQTQRASSSNRDAGWSERTAWGDPDLQGEWTTEGEYGVPLERPAQFGTRQFLIDAEYTKRLEDVQIRDQRDLARVDVLSGKVDGPNAPIPHWREYNTNSRRTSLVIDPPDDRLRS